MSMRTGSTKSLGRVALDSKNRVPLTRALAQLKKTLGTQDLGALTFSIQVDDAGRVILSPEIAIPAREAWIFRNPAAMESLQSGLNDVGQGRVVARGSFTQFADEDLE